MKEEGVVDTEWSIEPILLLQPEFHEFLLLLEAHCLQLLFQKLLRLSGENLLPVTQPLQHDILHFRNRPQQLLPEKLHMLLLPSPGKPRRQTHDVQMELDARLMVK